jgi:hypothetical protein
MRLIGLAALICSILTGCSGNLSSLFDDAGTQPTRPRRTSAPTFSPRPLPTPTATPAQTSTASPPAFEPTQFVSYATFRRHLVRTRDQVIKPMSRDLKRAADAGDLPGMRDAVREFRQWAEDEISWTHQRRPRDCFAQMFVAWRDTIDLMHEGLVVIEAGLMQIDIAEVERGVAMVEEANTLYEPGDAPVTCA